MSVMLEEETMKKLRMKKLVIGIAILTSISSFASSASLVIKCYEDSPGFSGENAARLCRNVKSDKDIKIAMKCYTDSPGTSGENSARLCANVKSDDDIKSVIKCFKESPGYSGKNSAILCSNIII